jgi:hypothetical protein
VWAVLKNAVFENLDASLLVCIAWGQLFFIVYIHTCIYSQREREGKREKEREREGKRKRERERKRDMLVTVCRTANTELVKFTTLNRF